MPASVVATFPSTGLSSLPDPLTIGRTFRPAGCYGFRLLCLEGADALLVDVTPTWPSLELRHGNPATTVPALDEVGPDGAQLMLQRAGSMSTGAPGV